MIRFAKGPLVRTTSKEEALAQLRTLPNFPKNAEVEVEDVRGQWVAAIATDEKKGSQWKVADNPFAGPEGGDDESKPPKEDKTPSNPDDAGDDLGSSDNAEDSDGPPSDEHEHKDKGEGGDKAVLHELLGIVTQMAQALGIAPPGGPEEGMGAGEDPSLEPGSGGPPPGAGGPPHGHGGPPPGGPDQTVQHQRALKPGEAPPGTTPVGAPAFASVADDHPWKDQIGKSATFKVKHRIPEDMKITQVESELSRIAYGTGFKVKQIGEVRDAEGHRYARALISAY